MTKVLQGDLAGVREMVDGGQDINVSSPMSPLMAAAGRGRLAMTRYLLDQGARVNGQAPNGKTALHAAAESGPLDVAALLIERGAKIDWLDKVGHTPLWGAAFYNRPR
jgi:ankyrin repeat protein